MSKTTMERAVELHLGVIHSLDFIRLKNEGRAFQNADGTVTVIGQRRVVSDETWTTEFERMKE